MLKPRLSICMPTYNFGKFIGSTLESIIDQMQEGVEIVVFDGGSTDDTFQIVQSYQKCCPSLSYHRQNHRGGIDRDMARVVDLANGEYCWLFSADDLMRKGALADILLEISGGLDLYLCGLTICTLDMRPMWQHRVLNLHSDAEFDLGNQRERLRYFQLAETTTAFFSFMGSLVVKKARWDAIPFDDSFDRSLWAHAARIFTIMMGQGLRMKYLAGSHLAKREGNDSFMDKGLVHRYKMGIDGYHRLANTFFGEDSAEAFHIRRVVRNEFPTLRPFLAWKMQIWDKGNREEVEQLDHLAETVYKDRPFANCIRYFICKVTSPPVYKSARAVYRSAKNLISGDQRAR